MRMTIYFYKVSNPYGYFSNFSAHGIDLGGRYWPTVEHYYQAQKFAGTKDEALMEVIRAAKTPEEAAALGRDPSRTVRSDWQKAKMEVMREAVFTKFLTHLEIQAKLVETGDDSIVEDSPTDRYWGCGTDKTGSNHLGKILMQVREQMRSRE